MKSINLSTSVTVVDRLEVVKPEVTAMDNKGYVVSEDEAKIEAIGRASHVDDDDDGNVHSKRWDTEKIGPQKGVVVTNGGRGRAIAHCLSKTPSTLLSKSSANILCGTGGHVVVGGGDEEATTPNNNKSDHSRASIDVYTQSDLRWQSRKSISITRDIMRAQRYLSYGGMCIKSCRGGSLGRADGTKSNNNNFATLNHDCVANVVLGTLP